MIIIIKAMAGDNNDHYHKLLFACSFDSHCAWILSSVLEVAWGRGGAIVTPTSRQGLGL